MAELKTIIQLICCSFIIVIALVNATRPAHHFNPDAKVGDGDVGTILPNEYELHLLRNTEPDSLATCRLQLLAAQLALNSANEITYDDVDGFLSPAQQRSKRAQQQQLRFRQCYFNPISCFRK